MAKGVGRGAASSGAFPVWGGERLPLPPPCTKAPLRPPAMWRAPSSPRAEGPAGVPLRGSGGGKSVAPETPAGGKRGRPASRPPEPPPRRGHGRGHRRVSPEAAPGTCAASLGETPAGAAPAALSKAVQPQPQPAEFRSFGGNLGSLRRRIGSPGWGRPLTVGAKGAGGGLFFWGIGSGTRFMVASVGLGCRACSETRV